MHSKNPLAKPDPSTNPPIPNRLRTPHQTRQHFRRTGSIKVQPVGEFHAPGRQAFVEIPP